MHKFDPLTIPLKGQQLVEASAGTGKTYSISQLYLRFILEAGLDVTQILVVTFTTSATEELRQRIRSRLRQALDVLVRSGQNTILTEDTVLQAILAKVAEREEAALRLTDGIARMDESAVFTIHSFCQRMLQDNVFESGSTFDTEFIENENHLRLEIIQDFWRRRFYPALPAETAWAAQTWQDPHGLLKVLNPLLSQTQITCIPQVNDEELEGLRRSMNESFRAAMASWQAKSAEIIEILRNDTSLKRNANAYRDDQVQKALAGMEKLSSADSAPWILPECTDRLAASVMEGHLMKNKTAPGHAFFDLFDVFYQHNLELTDRGRVHVLLSAFRFLQSELRRRKHERAQMYFDDLLTGLDRALAAPGGGELARRIRDRYKVALVDEFQDTDPVQYRIFHTLFGKGEDPGLFMIGDPKQSIYSFRGADVFAYIKAKKDTLSRSAAFTMDTNYRSTPAMVEAVNRLFDRDDSFVFGNDISFSSVRSGGRAGDEPFIVQGKIPAPFQAMFLPVDSFAAERKNDISKERAGRAASSWTAAEIARLLGLGKTGEARIGSRSLTGGDLAVLVRTHREAEMVQQELAGLRIASVYYSQDSVFSTEEARELHHVMLALLDLSDTSRVSAALATPLFGLNAKDIEQRMSDAARWDEMISGLEEHHIQWRNQGFAPMLQKLFSGQNVVQRLVDLHGGERKLTNYLHLAELLQSASEEQPGMDGLVRWFDNQRLDPDETSANQQLRLESDENLVRIVTVHKAKGLEYPIVFLPFLWSCRAVSLREVYSYHRPPDYDLVADIGSGDDAGFLLAERERLAEDLRLLYVAVTRARYCCYFSWGRINKMEGSAMAWLLHRDGRDSAPVFAELNEERILRDLASLNTDEEFLEFLEDSGGRCEEISPAGDAQGRLASRIFHGQIDTSWSISSYSKMVRASVHMNRAEEVEREQPGSYPEMKGQSVFTFPRGAAAGTCLHNIFEQIDFAEFNTLKMEPLVRQQLQLDGLDVGWSQFVCSWISNILQTPLDKETGLQLQGLQQKDRLAELGFYFSMDRIDPAALNRVLKDYGFSPIMLSDMLAGLMRGYIDLVFRHGGRYFLADYKSNYLGSTAADYHPSGLADAMESHRYDLQYLIYTVALHRYLQTRIKDYAYEKHFGGVFYLFLRGMHPDHPSGNGLFQTIPDRELVERLDACFGRPGMS